MKRDRRLVKLRPENDSREKIGVRNRMHLRHIIRERVDKEGPHCDLNDIDVSNITSFYALFRGIEFDGDISEWDVRKVKDMSYMFSPPVMSKTPNIFNGDISDWQTDSLEETECMFLHSMFDGDLSDWNMSNVENMAYMFNSSEFTGDGGDIGKWDLKSGVRVTGMFTDSKFDGDLSDWDAYNFNAEFSNYNNMFLGCPLGDERNEHRRPKNRKFLNN